jgi:hypothetical protein
MVITRRVGQAGRGSTAKHQAESPARSKLDSENKETQPRAGPPTVLVINAGGPAVAGMTLAAMLVME